MRANTEIVRIEGLEELARHFDRVQPETLLPKIMRGVVQETKKVAEKAPKPSSGSPRWTSIRQKRWYHWARKNAGLALRYARLVDPWSKQLEKNWKTSVESSGQIGRVYNETPYAQYVYGDAQQGFHKDTGWKNLQGIVMAAKDKVMRRMAEDLKDFLEKL